MCAINSNSLRLFPLSGIVEMSLTPGNKNTLRETIWIRKLTRIFYVRQFYYDGIMHITVLFHTESGDYTDYSDDDYLETRRRRSRRNQKRQVNYKEDSESDGSQKSVRYGKELRRVHKRRLSTSDSEGKIDISRSRCMSASSWKESYIIPRFQRIVFLEFFDVSQKLFPSETAHWYFMMHWVTFQIYHCF